MTINKFYTLNKMQRSVTGGFSMGIYLWEVNVELNGQKRVVSFIRKDKTTGFYTVSLTGEMFKTFMGALASLLPFYVTSLRKMIRSQCPLDYTADNVAEVLNMLLSDASEWDLNLEYEKAKAERPTIPVYDRGAKKEVLHPLRRAVTNFFGGKYSR